MKISCQSCQAKYTIADEKVLGKVVKIRCKKCSATIVINGNESARPQEEGAADGNVFDYTAQQSSTEQWTVNVADGDQRTLGVAEIVAEYRAGVINDETFCWKDGMSDWLPLREVEALYAAATLGPRPTLTLDGDHAGGLMTGGSLPPAAPAQDTGGGGLGSLFGPGNTDAATDEVQSPYYAGAGAGAGANGNGAGANLFGGGEAAQAASAPAARRAGGRGGQGADLFGGVAQAGGEEDMMSAAPNNARAEADAKLTGQRNENSVLFSLSALTASETKAGGGGSSTAQTDGSGLIDIRALSATMSTDSKPQGNHIDDIMNLGGGGAFGAALAAPILAPPTMDASEMMGGGTAGGNNKVLMFAILGAGAFIAIAIVIAVFATRGGGATATGPTGSAASGVAPIGSLAVADTVTPPTTPAADPTDPAGGPAAPGTGGPGTTSAPATGPKATGTAATAAAPKNTATAAGPTRGPTAAPPPPPPAATGLAGALAAAAGATATAAPAAGGSDAPPFDRGAAAGALGSVNAAACKKADGPTGSGHVTVVFDPKSGSVQSATVDGPPFAGTAVGGCVAGKFRSAHIPPFSGSSVKVGKSFTIN